VVFEIAWLAQTLITSTTIARTPAMIAATTSVITTSTTNARTRRAPLHPGSNFRIRRSPAGSPVGLALGSCNGS
jgi:hypothetical protein